MSKYGARAGLFFGIVGFAALAGPPIAGGTQLSQFLCSKWYRNSRDCFVAILDDSQGQPAHFDHMIFFSGALTLGGTAFFWLARFVSRPKLFAKY